MWGGGVGDGEVGSNLSIIKITEIHLDQIQWFQQNKLMGKIEICIVPIVKIILFINFLEFINIKFH